jgi:ABC-type branched-subunit amino acid transport system ATPase component
VAEFLLEVDAIESGYGKKTVLQGVGLRVREGEVVAVLGHNGAGKSTTLRTILGLLPARAGEVSSRASPGPTAIRWRTCAMEWRWCRRAAACFPISP